MEDPDWWGQAKLLEADDNDKRCNDKPAKLPEFDIIEWA